MSITKLPRPLVLGGLVVKKKTGCGNLYIQMAWYKGTLFEVFATLGHSGACGMAFSEALTRSITIGLRCGIPVNEYIDQLRGIRCLTPVAFPKEVAVTSCPDAMAATLAKYGNLSIEQVVKIMMGENGNSAELQDERKESEEAIAKANLEKLKSDRRKAGL